MPLTESIALGLALGFLLYEWLGLAAGGLVAPGYLALYLNRPDLLAATLAASFVTLGLVKLLGRWTILYGRRRFMLMLLTGFALQGPAHWVLARWGSGAMEIDTIGYIIPGLIANDMERQGVLPTLAALVLVAVAVRLLLAAFGLLEVW